MVLKDAPVCPAELTLMSPHRPQRCCKTKGLRRWAMVTTWLWLSGSMVYPSTLSNSVAMTVPVIPTGDFTRGVGSRGVAGQVPQQRPHTGRWRYLTRTDALQGTVSEPFRPHQPPNSPGLIAELHRDGLALT